MTPPLTNSQAGKELFNDDESESRSNSSTQPHDAQHIAGRSTSSSPSNEDSSSGGGDEQVDNSTNNCDLAFVPSHVSYRIEVQPPEASEENPDAATTQSSDRISQVKHVTGDASRPSSKHYPAVILQCLDGSGRWPHAGFFLALERAWPGADLAAYVRKAKRAGELHLGDVHLLPLEGSNGQKKEGPEQKTDCRLCLLIANRWVSGKSDPILDLKAFEYGLGKLQQVLTAENTVPTVHTPRLDRGRQFENCLDQFLVQKGIHTTVYYFSKRRHSHSEDDVHNSSRSQSSENESEARETVGSNSSFTPSVNAAKRRRTEMNSGLTLNDSAVAREDEREGGEKAKDDPGGGQDRADRAEESESNEDTLPRRKRRSSLRDAWLTLEESAHESI